MSNEAEEGVIGGLLLLEDGNSKLASMVLSMLKPANFQNEFLRLAYKSIQNLDSEGRSFNPFIVDHTLQDRSEYQQYGGMGRLAEISQKAVMTNALIDYAKIVKNESIKRYAEKKLFEALQMMSDSESGSIQERLGLLDSLIYSIQQNTLETDERALKHIKEVGREWLEVAEQRQEGKITGNTTGIPSIDEILAPAYIPNQSLFVVGARPKMGKTSFLARIVDHYASQNKTVAMFNLEMPNISAFERILCTTTGAGMSDLYRTWDESTCSNIMSGATKLKDKNIYMCEKAGIDIGFLQRECRTLHKDKKINLICIDYLTLMKGEKADTNNLAYAKITTALKNLAKELNCVVLLLTQLNRNLESRPDKRPLPSDSRDTGQIEQDCDIWIGLYREAVYNEDFEHKGLTEAIIRSNRHGQTGTGYLDLQGGVFRDTDADQAKRMSEAAEMRPIGSQSF